MTVTASARHPAAHPLVLPQIVTVPYPMSTASAGPVTLLFYLSSSLAQSPLVPLPVLLQSQAKSTLSRLNASPAEKAARQKRLATAVRTVLECIGEDPDREGLLRTPERYAQALMWMTKGYEEPSALSAPPTNIAPSARHCKYAFSANLQSSPSALIPSALIFSLQTRI